MSDHERPTREEIFQLAKEAGFHINNSIYWVVGASPTAVEKFVDLIIKHCVEHKTK